MLVEYLKYGESSIQRKFCNEMQVLKILGEHTRIVQYILHVAFAFCDSFTAILI
jgi:hypothetical protein